MVVTCRKPPAGVGMTMNATALPKVCVPTTTARLLSMSVPVRISELEAELPFTRTTMGMV